MEGARESPGEITLLLQELRLGDKDALGLLVPLVYRELKRLAGHYLQMERRGHTLQPTALVHEAYLRLVEQDHAQWQNRAQFLAVAARLMRRILINYAKARGTAKRGGAAVSLDIAGPDIGTHDARPEEVLAVDEALDRLAALDAQQARVVELRYFAGLTIEETAEALGISPRTVKREWTTASAWLRTELSAPGDT
jgi:RNA polymerase sigma factor (TIGR02999 family)